MSSKFKPGDRVKLSAHSRVFGFGCGRNGTDPHYQEFKDSTGVVLGHPYPDWPEWDVRWEPSNLKYAYADYHLEKVE